MSRRGWAATLVVAAALLAGSFVLVHHAGWYAHRALTDVGGYHRDEHAIAAGQVPYRDFPLEYPPAALVAFLAPAALPWSYGTSFAVVMFLSGVACLVAAALVLDAVDAEPGRVWFALGFVAIAPLALGALFDTRFDLWPAALAVGALAAVLRRRAGVGGVLLGLGFAAKLWPVVLAPLLLAYAWRRWGRHAAFVGSVSFAATVVVCFAPFAVLAPGGVWHSLTAQLRRPLQVESLGAATLMALHHAGGVTLRTVTTHGSQNLAGSTADAVGTISTVLVLVLVASVWIGFGRRREPSGDALILACAAAVAVCVAFSKVFSPQFLIWLVPLVPLVRGRRGLVASVLLGAALLLTQTWFSHHYWALALDYATPWSWLLLARDLAVVALVVTLAWPGREPLPEHHARLAAFQAIRPRA
ncbi:MAG TPA: glycosyltransferase 87 family protein [Gaiellaceae bacterium]|nr:glycosyltransferase 87 family protein [Gaiellaceae bacterium]